MIPILPQAIESYCVNHSSAASPLLNELEAYTREHCAYAQMLVGPLEGGLLRMLVQLTGARNILEIGLFTGYSALTMAEALPQDGTLISCDINAENAKIAESFFMRSPHGKKITVRLGPAMETLHSVAEKPLFDLVFIDADKENYLNYYAAVLPRVVSGGLILADNTLWSGKVLNPQEQSDKAIVAFNQHVQQDARVDNLLLSIRDGIMLIRKK